MFVEEARWIRSRLEPLPVQPGMRVLDIGSSTLEYRTVQQPHITEFVHAPLLARGASIASSDLKAGEGIDLVLDLTRSDLPDATFAIPYDLVICSNILEHVADRRTFIGNVVRFCRDGSYLLCTVPRSYPHHADPIDTMYRPTADELAAFITSVAPADVLHAEVIRIDDRSYYEFTPGRILDHLLLRKLRMRWHGRVPALRWKVACALLRLRGNPAVRPLGQGGLR